MSQRLTPPPVPITPDTFLPFNSLGARLILLLFIGLHLAMTISSFDAVKSPLAAVLTFLLVASAAMLLCVAAPYPFPLRRTALVLALCTAAAFSVWNLADSGRPGWESWMWGAVTFVLFVVAVRGRIAAAWLGFGLMSLITLTWTLAVGRGPVAAFDLLVRHAGLLFVATLFAVLLARTAATVNRVQQAELTRTEQDARHRAALEEQSARLDRLRLQVSPLMVRLGSALPLTADDRQKASLMEATLRDQLRGGGLLTPQVADAAWRARTRGVEVTLLDDRDQETLSDSARARIEEALVTRLDGAATGSVTARLLPAGRPELATVVVDDGERSERETIPAPD